jgi:predicted AAA+ superfamily ATPase
VSLLTISDENLFQRLAFDNPWWEFTSGSEINFRRPAKRVFFAPFFSRVEKAGAPRDFGGLVVLAGPLRAGKTVMVRQAVAQLIENGVSPSSVCICSMALPSLAGAEPESLLRVFSSRFGHGRESGLFLFFDEVQYVQDWRKKLTVLAEAWPKARFVAIVSSGGEPSDFVLPPLTFLEFLRFRKTEDKLFGTGAAAGGSEKPATAMVLAPGALTALNDEFHRYVNFGGFPDAVLGHGADGGGGEGGASPAFIRDGLIDGVLHKDLAGLHGINDTRELNRLFALLARNTALEVSIEELAKAVGVAKNTLRKYLDYLESAFLIRRLARVDRHAKRFQRAVAFKVYLTSPCLYAALFGPVSADDKVFPRLAETALVSQWLGSRTKPGVPGARDSLAYASWRGGAIDLLAIDRKSGKPDRVYELDWGDEYAGAGAKASKGPGGLTDFVKETNPEAKAYILTRETARQGVMAGVDITLAPLSLYAYWLERAAENSAPGPSQAGD